MAIRSPYLGFGSGFDVIAIPKETDCHTSDIGHWFAMTLNWEGPRFGHCFAMTGFFGRYRTMRSVTAPTDTLFDTSPFFIDNKIF